MKPNTACACPHWAVMLPGAFCIVVAIAVYASTANTLAGSICLLAGTPALIRGGIQLATARISLDSQRIVISSGLFSRSSVEIRHEEVATFDCYQSVLGRLLGYGVIGITTRGSNRYLTPPIADHRALAAHLNNCRSQVQ
ncbi:PH domain-containing protein [Pseudomonas sp. EMN2]|uniref:PH domain-containing protein n=1 Tax=Pseudomonas sp. EMN2 TaxID=2615212 RepID=UPI00129BC672|nr:PH domain-containing protein [Pseudomonas sp. EMN2]